MLDLNSLEVKLMRRAVETDKAYMELVADIIDHDEFLKVEKCIHHLNNRYDHSIRVSYISYRLSKLLRLNYRAAARAGLLHDFFISEGEKNKKEKVYNLFKHPKYAVINTKKHFKIDKMEENIIASHMFPFCINVPKYLESWIVDIVDDLVAVYELSKVKKAEFQTGFNILMIIILNSIK